MRRLRDSLSFCLSVLVFYAVPSRGEETVFSGPQVGERLTPFKVVLAYGEHQGKEIELVGSARGKPALLVIVRGANRPAARLTRALMNYAEMRAHDGLFAAMVWLEDDRSRAEQYLERAISWWGMGPPVGISVDGAEGPGSYGFNRHVNVTVLVANENRVTANFALVQPSPTEAPKILGEVVKLIGGKVPTDAETVFLSIPTRRPRAAKWNAAPRDAQFRELICRLLAAADAAAASKAAAALDKFVGGDPSRQSALTRVAGILSRGRTRVRSIPATRYIRAWQEAESNERIKTH